jgi:EmrB/QacA subfamily drug resistance transporter
VNPPPTAVVGTAPAGANAPVSPDVVVHDPRRKRLILAAMCTALMGVVASVSGLNVAQQDLAREFGASQGAILWMINGYTVALASLLMPFGAIGDRWGRKPVLVSGLGLFFLSSVGAALAPSIAFMIAARVVAGIGASMIMPVTLSVITSTFPEEERAQAIGIWAGVAGSGGLVGLFVSSFMVDMVNWRWLFVLPAALAVVSLWLTSRAVPNSREHFEHPFDIAGSVLSFFAIGGLVLGIHEGPENGWGSPLTVAGLGVGLACLVAFIMWERRHADPLLDVSVFRNHGLSSGALTLMLLFGVMFGIFLVLFPFLQAVLGYSALKSAVSMLPMAVVMMPMSALAPQIAQRFGSRRTMLIGTGVGATGLAVLALRASVEGGYWSILPGLVIMGAGNGLAMTPSTEAITASLPVDKQGVASALNDTSREIGGAVGVALLGSILSSGYRSAIEPSLAGLPKPMAEAAAEGIGNAFGVAQKAGPAGPKIISAAQHAFVDGWTGAMWVGVAMMGIAFLYLLLAGPRGTSDEVALHVE